MVAHIRKATFEFEACDAGKKGDCGPRVWVGGSQGAAGATASLHIIFDLWGRTTHMREMAISKGHAHTKVKAVDLGVYCKSAR